MLRCRRRGSEDSWDARGLMSCGRRFIGAGMAKLARRSGLKIRWAKAHPGSIPGPGTIVSLTFAHPCVLCRHLTKEPGGGSSS